MSWSAQQQRMLSAMGLSPMHRRASSENLRVAESPPQPAAPQYTTSQHAPPRAAPAPVPPRAAPAPAPASRPGALLEALRRAAGGRDIADLVADLERLRREPALKRALWPRLRALRRH